MDEEISKHLDYDLFIQSCVGCVGLIRTKEIVKHYFELKEMEDMLQQDELYEQNGRLSAAYLQRKLRISYTAAANLIKEFNEKQVKN